MSRLITFPVLIAARHVRLTRPHFEVLFGPGSEPVDAVYLPPTDTFATPDVIDLRGPAGTLRGVRVVGPLAARTEVRLAARDLQTLGIDAAAAAHGPLDVDRSPGCTLVGPRGTVVLAAGVLVGLRRLSLTRELATEASLEPGARASVQVRGERARDLRDVPVELGSSAWLSVDVEDGNALEVGPSTRASLVAG